MNVFVVTFYLNEKMTGLKVFGRLDKAQAELICSDYTFEKKQGDIETYTYDDNNALSGKIIYRKVI